MNISKPILAGAALLALALPLAVSAQTTPVAPATTTTAGEHRHHGGGLNRRALQGITLSDSQKSQIAQLRAAYKTAHPKGSTPDPAARKALRDQMLGILTPDQRTQYEANMKTLRENHKNAGNGPFAPNASPTPGI
jgi:Spy/CpxP family protein refolding chaperone